MEILSTGVEYSELPNTFVIFICDFDLFGQKKYRYTFRRTCQETEQAYLEDGSNVIFLSTKGKNDDEVPVELTKFLKLVGAELHEMEQDFEDEFVEQLQRTMREIKVSREMGARYVIFQEMLRDERKLGHSEGIAEGRADAILELLEEFGEIPAGLCERIQSEKNLDVLKEWNKLAARVNSIEEFQKDM